MEISQTQYKRIEHCFPRPRGSFKISNLNVLNAILYVLENGCKWRGLPKYFGNWHTIYTRMNRWSKNGVLDQIFIELQQEQILLFKIEIVSLDSTSVKVHPEVIPIIWTANSHFLAVFQAIFFILQQGITFLRGT